MLGIKLIVGLGNPGKNYAQTRHNAGVWLVQSLADQHGSSLRTEAKFNGLVSALRAYDEKCWLLVPTTYMNDSGRAVRAMSQFFHLSASSILIVHDELDLPPGMVRFKKNGGDGGHNGLKDIAAQLGSKEFWRLRIGIGHPGHRDRVHDYVLNAPSVSDRNKIEDAISRALQYLPEFINGQQEKAMQNLHTLSDN